MFTRMTNSFTATTPLPSQSPTHGIDITVGVAVGSSGVDVGVATADGVAAVATGVGVAGAAIGVAVPWAAVIAPVGVCVGPVAAVAMGAVGTVEVGIGVHAPGSLQPERETLEFRRAPASRLRLSTAVAGSFGKK